MCCIFTLVTNLGLAELALTMHAFSACVNGQWQLCLKILYLRTTTALLHTNDAIQFKCRSLVKGKNAAIALC